MCIRMSFPYHACTRSRRRPVHVHPDVLVARAPHTTCWAFARPGNGPAPPVDGPCAGLERSAGPSNGCRRRRMRRGAIWLRAAGAVDASGGHPRASLGDGSRSGAQPSGCLLRVVCNRLAKAFPVCRSRIADYVFKDHQPDGKVAYGGAALLRPYRGRGGSAHLMDFEEILRSRPRRRASPRIAEDFSPTASGLSTVILLVALQHP